MVELKLQLAEARAVLQAWRHNLVRARVRVRVRVELKLQLGSC